MKIPSLVDQIIVSNLKVITSNLPTEIIMRSSNEVLHAQINTIVTVKMTKIIPCII